MLNRTKIKYTLELTEGVVEHFKVDSCWGNPKITCLCNSCAGAELRTHHCIIPFKHQTHETCDMLCGKQGTDYAVFEYIGYNNRAA